jgi:hypothetical protein
MFGECYRTATVRESVLFFTPSYNARGDKSTGWGLKFRTACADS